MKIIDKTYITRSGKDIRDSKLPGTVKVDISEANRKVAEKRIKIAQDTYAHTITQGHKYLARRLTK